MSNNLNCVCIDDLVVQKQRYRSDQNVNFLILLKQDRPQFSDNNRLKFAPFQTVFFNTFQYGKETDVWDERVVGVGTELIILLPVMWLWKLDLLLVVRLSGKPNR